MQRRSILYAMLGLAPAAHAWQQEAIKLPASAAEAVAMGLPKFFNPADFAAFAELGETLIPAYDGRPGAKDAEAAEFLDFLISQSPAEVKTLYRQGIATYRQRRRAGVDAALKELTEPWTYEGPKAPYAKFLQAAKQAFFQATVNSRQWAEAMQGRSRAAAGVGSYWLPIE